MKIDELMRDILRELGYPNEAADQAKAYADSFLPDEASRKMLEVELTEEQIRLYKMYVGTTLLRCLQDPEFREQFLKKGKELHGNPNT
jgi:hypothetical protein